MKKLYWGIHTYVSTCSVFLVFVRDFYRTSIAFEKGGKTKEDFEKYVTNIDTLIIGSHDVGIALQNAVVEAESLGLVTKELNLTKYVIPIVGL